MQLRERQARYPSRKKTLLQLLMAVTVADLTLVLNKAGLMGAPNAVSSIRSSLLSRFCPSVSHLGPPKWALWPNPQTPSGGTRALRRQPPASRLASFCPWPAVAVPESASWRPVRSAARANTHPVGLGPPTAIRTRRTSPR